MTGINALGQSHALWELYRSVSASNTNATSAPPDSGSTKQTQSADRAQNNSTPPAKGLTGLNGSPLDPSLFVFMIDMHDAPSGQPAQSGALGSISSQLFGSLDEDGDGSISQSELEQGFTAAGATDNNQADAVFKALDANGDGSVSQSELQSGLKAAHHHHHMHAGEDDMGSSGGADGADPLMALFGTATESSSAADRSGTSPAGQTTQTVTNPDGSTTTTTTYADGSTVTLTTPATNTADSGAQSAAASQFQSSLQNLLQMMAQLESSAFTAPQPSPVTA